MFDDMASRISGKQCPELITIKSLSRAVMTRISIVEAQSCSCTNGVTVKNCGRCNLFYSSPIRSRFLFFHRLLACPRVARTLRGSCHGFLTRDISMCVGISTDDIYVRWTTNNVVSSKALELKLDLEWSQLVECTTLD